MKRTMMVLGCFTALALVSTALQAQPGQGRRPGGIGRGPGGGAGGLSPTALLNVEAVQKEIELLDDQKQEITKLREESRGNSDFRELFSGLRDLSEEDRRAKFTEIREKMEKDRKAASDKVLGVLLPHQRERLEEISLQIRGPAALTDDEVAGALKLSDDQRKQLEEVNTSNREKMGELFRGAGRDANRDELREKMEAMRKESSDALLAVLTTEQRSTFEAMKGDKFEISPEDLRNAMFGGRGGPGQGRRPGGEGGQRRPGGEGGQRRPGGDGERTRPRPEAN